MEIGLYFGSFNPIHMGHLIVANTIRQQANLSEVWFVISPLSPFKKQTDLLHHFDRYELVKQAIADNYHLRPCDVEFNMPQPNYTVKTLTVLQEKHPDKTFSLIIGEDNLAGLHKWKNYETLLKYHNVLVYPRPGNPKNYPLKDHPSVVRIDAPVIDISATFIRKLIKQGKSIRYLVPDSAVTYINFKKLYL